MQSTESTVETGRVDTRGLKIAFGKAEQGWLQLRLTGPTGHFECEGADLPHDWVRHLVDVLARLGQAAEPIACTVDVFLEPAGCELVFDGSGAVTDQLTLSAWRYDDYHAGNQARRRLEFQFTGTRAEVWLALWQGLRELGERAGREDYAAHWDSAFPQAELERLAPLAVRFEADRSA